MSSREKFEAWYLEKCGHREDDHETLFERCHDGDEYYRLGVSMAHGAWQASESASEQKLTDMAVQLANAESKCRELAAENARLKSAHPQPFGPEMMKALDAYEKHQDEVPETGMLNAFFILRDSIRVETPATDVFLAEVRAQGVDALAQTLEGLVAVSVTRSYIMEFAAKLRKGASL